MITVTATSRPAQAVATATATVQIEGGAARNIVIDKGLAALGESRASLFGYGVRAADGREIRSAAIWDQTVTVYAHRD